MYQEGVGIVSQQRIDSVKPYKARGKECWRKGVGLNMASLGRSRNE